MNDALVTLKERIESALSVATQSEEAAANALASVAQYILDDCPKRAVQDEAGYFDLLAWYAATLSTMHPPRTWALWEECVTTLDSLLLATVSRDDPSDLARWLQSFLTILQPEGTADQASNFQIVRATMAITILPIESVMLASLSFTLSAKIEAQRANTHSVLADHLKVWLLRKAVAAARTAGLQHHTPMPASIAADISAASRWWCCDVRVALACVVVLPLLDTPETRDVTTVVSQDIESALARLPSDGTPKQPGVLGRELSMVFMHRADQLAQRGSLCLAIAGYTRAIQIAPGSACAAEAAGSLLQIAIASGNHTLRRDALPAIETWIHRVCTGTVRHTECSSAP